MEVYHVCASFDGSGAFFFFQAEDGIRDVAVTGVQTCALPICAAHGVCRSGGGGGRLAPLGLPRADVDRKSTRLNSSHGYISYAVFCLKKKKKRSHVIHVRPRSPRRGTRGMQT